MFWIILIMLGILLTAGSRVLGELIITGFFAYILFVIVMIMISGVR